MCKEKVQPTETYMPIMLCPDCVDEGLQIDPRIKVPTYPIIESTCFTHLIIRGKIHPLISHPNPKARVRVKTSGFTIPLRFS